MTHLRKLSPLALIVVLLAFGVLTVNRIQWIRDGRPSPDEPGASSEIQPSPEEQQALSEMHIHAAYIRSREEDIFPSMGTPGGTTMTVVGRGGKLVTVWLPWPFNEDAPIDPWGNEYQIMWKKRDEWSVRSLGSDGKPGTKDDMVLRGQS